MTKREDFTTVFIINIQFLARIVGMVGRGFQQRKNNARGYEILSDIFLQSEGRVEFRLGSVRLRTKQSGSRWNRLLIHSKCRVGSIPSTPVGPWNLILQPHSVGDNIVKLRLLVCLSFNF